MGDFEVDTRLEGGAGRYTASLSPDWEIWGPNGGYLAAIALRAAGREAGIQRPASFSGHFLSVARFEPVDVHVRTIRRGRRSESMHVEMRQEAKPILQAIVRTAVDGPGLEHDAAVAPDVPDPEKLRNFEELRPGEPPFYPFWQNLEGRPLWPERHDAEPRPYEPVLQEWFRFRPTPTFDDPFVDASRLLLLLDTMSWPAAAMPHPGRPYQAPNLDVSAWFHRIDPGSAWLLIDLECPVAEGGLMGTTGRVWSRDRRLLASGGAQLMCVPDRSTPGAPSS
jgi:acyl-CoA thioesterase-2